jgi:hypothetical protein
MLSLDLESIQGFTPGIEGTNKYNQLIQLQKDVRKKQGQLKIHFI